MHHSSRPLGILTLTAHHRDWYHAGSQWKATGLETRLKVEGCLRKQVDLGREEFYLSQFFTSLFFVYTVLCSIFLAFSIETEEHLNPLWKSCKVYFRENFYMGKSLLQLFCWFSGLHRIKFQFPWKFHLSLLQSVEKGCVVVSIYTKPVVHLGHFKAGASLCF